MPQYYTKLLSPIPPLKTQTGYPFSIKVQLIPIQERAASLGTITAFTRVEWFLLI